MIAPIEVIEFVGTVEAARLLHCHTRILSRFAELHPVLVDGVKRFPLKNVVKVAASRGHVTDDVTAKADASNTTTLPKRRPRSRIPSVDFGDAQCPHSTAIKYRDPARCSSCLALAGISFPIRRQVRS